VPRQGYALDYGILRIRVRPAVARRTQSDEVRERVRIVAASTGAMVNLLARRDQAALAHPLGALEHFDPALRIHGVALASL